MVKQLDLFEQLLNTTQTQKELPIQNQKQETSRKIRDTLSGLFNYKFSYNVFNSYKIEIKDGKINKVKFQIGEYKFQVYIEYDFKKENVKRLNYTETDKEDRENFINLVKVKNLYILATQKKEKVGYGPVKHVNYFRYAGLEYNQVIRFLEALIKDYHL